MGDVNRVLGVGDGQEVSLVGRTILIKESQGPIRLVMEGHDNYIMQEGDKLIAAVPFQNFRIENVHGATNRLILTVTDGDYASARVAREVTLAPAGALAAGGDQSIANATTDTIASNAGRSALTIQTDPGNTGVLRLRDENGNTWGWLAAGGSVTLDSTAAVQLRNDSGAAQTYAYVEAL